jgi:hypothetical protein
MPSDTAEPSDEALIETLQARVAELEEDQKHMWPASDDASSVFIDGHGSVDLDYDDARLKRAEAAEADRDRWKEDYASLNSSNDDLHAENERLQTALAECRAKVIEECAAVADLHGSEDDPEGPSTARYLASAIRALAKEAKA